MVAKVVEIGLGEVERTLQETVDSEVELLQVTSQHILGAGGKRIRPRLLFLAYMASGGTDINSVVALASAIELVHTATLVHDDINDHSPTRRGKVAVHARWGRTFALLTGDYLFTKVYELMAPYGTKLNAIMARACVNLVEGETLQAEAAKSGSINRETYKKIISLKTASLFEAAAEMGVWLADGSLSISDCLRGYGYNLGMAFQLTDDVLDIIGDPSTIGKPVGGDLVQGTGAMMTQNGKKAWIESFSTNNGDPVQQIMTELRSSGALEVALMQAQKYAVRATEALKSVPPSQARDELHSLVQLVVDREQ